MSNCLVADARELMHQLKGEKVPKYLRDCNNIHELDVEWSNPDMDPTDNNVYLTQFCQVSLLLHVL